MNVTTTCLNIIPIRSKPLLPEEGVPVLWLRRLPSPYWVIGTLRDDGETHVDMELTWAPLSAFSHWCYLPPIPKE